MHWETEPQVYFESNFDSLTDKTAEIRLPRHPCMVRPPVFYGDLLLNEIPFLNSSLFLRDTFIYEGKYSVMFNQLTFPEMIGKLFWAIS